MDWLSHLLTALASAAAAFAGGWAAFGRNRRDDFRLLFDQQILVIKELQTRLDSQGKEIEALKSEHVECRAENARLRGRVAALEAEIIELKKERRS